MKKYGVNIFNLIIGLLLIFVGIFFMAGNTEYLTKILFICIGLLMIIININPLIYSIKNNNTYEVIYRLLLVIFGVMFIFYHNTAISIIIALIFIICPIISIVLSNNRKEELTKQLPTILIGLLVLILGPAALGKVLFIILGIILFVFGILISISSFYKQEIIK